MSSNIKVQRICQLCGNEFTARTTVTKYCSDVCVKKAYKTKVKNEKISKSNIETLEIKIKQVSGISIEEVRAKEFLSVSDVAILLNINKRTIYRLIENGIIKAVNLAERMTLIRRCDIDKLFELVPIPPPLPKANKKKFNEEDYYTITEVQTKFSVSDSALQIILKRNKIEKLKRGWFVYVLKTDIDKLFNA